MKVADASEVLRADRVTDALSDGNLYRMSHYFQPHLDGGLQVFMVDLRQPRGVVRPHFHVVEQYQVVVGGGGRIGREPFDPLAVHYVDRFSTYGPITAGMQGIKYVTLRMQRDPGAQYMPESRRAKTEPSRRNLAWHEATGVHRASAGSSVSIIPRQEDGLEAWRRRLNPGSQLTTQAEDTGGQFILLYGGTASVENHDLTRLSCIHIGPDDAEIRIIAGQQGADLVILTFPTGALRPVLQASQ